MTTDETEVKAARRGGGRGPRSRPMNDESNGLLKTLWADLRKKELPRAEDPAEDAWYEEEERRRQEAAKIGRVHHADADRRESWRRRYWNS